MRVEPEDEEGPADVLGVTRHARDAAHRQRVVAAENDGEMSLARGIVHGFVERARESCNGLQIVGAGMVGEIACGQRPQIPLVIDRMAEFGEDRVYAGDPERRRPHGCAAAARAFLDGCADQCDGLHVRLVPSPCCREVRFP